MMNAATVLQELTAFMESQPLVSSHSHRIPYEQLQGKNDLFNAFVWHSG